MNIIRNQIMNFKLSNSLLALAAMIVIAVIILASGATNALVIGVTAAAVVWVLAPVWNAYSAKNKASKEVSVVSIADYRNIKTGNRRSGLITFPNRPNQPTITYGTRQK